MRTKKVLSILLLLIFISFATGCLPELFNQKPIIGSTPGTTAKVGVLYTYEIVATDPDADDVLTYSLTEKPTGMTINGTTGAVSWTPAENQGTESYTVTIEVSDGIKSVFQTFTITVAEAELSSIVVVPSEMTVYIGDSKPITSVTAHYDNETSASIALSSASYSSNHTNIATVNNSGVVTGVSVGTATITVSYTEDSITKTDTISVTVQEQPILDSISVQPLSMIMYVGASQAITSITASYTNAPNASIELSLAGYSSLNPAIATVNSSGVVTGVSAGETTIIVTYTEGGITRIDTVDVTIVGLPG